MKKIEKLLPKLRQECLAFLSEELSKKGSICFDDDAPDDFDPIYISYDGGAHPEYASNAFSTVYDVHLNDKGDIELCIEETDELRDRSLYYYGGVRYCLPCSQMYI